MFPLFVFFRGKNPGRSGEIGNAGSWHNLPPKGMIRVYFFLRLARFDGQSMVKLSISLPNNTQITLESDEPDVINQVLGMLLHGSTPDAAPVSVPAAAVANGHNGSVEKSTDATPEQPAAPPQSNGASHPKPADAQPSNGASLPQPSESQPSNGTMAQAVPQRQPAPPATNGMHTEPALPPNDPDDDGLFLEAQTPESREDFTVFCQTVNPMGDMRRVVVAAEGASRFFRADGVNAEELGELFDLAGWRRANSFTQTLRNAARSKFGWLERVPGRAGCYAPTDLGREVTLGG